MSVSLVTVRVNTCNQFQHFPEMTLEEANEISADWYFSPDSGFWVLTEYRFIQIITAGWTGGAFMRTKNVSLTKALSYVNKLHAGKWIDDNTYDTMYTLVDQLLSRFDPVRTAQWEVPPFDFANTQTEES